MASRLRFFPGEEEDSSPQTAPLVGLGMGERMHDAPDTASESLGHDEVRRLLTSKYAEREENERARRERKPDLSHFPQLFHSMTLTGLLETGEGRFKRRLPWLAGYVLVSASPFIPALFVRTSSVSSGRFLTDILFTLFVGLQGMDLAQTLSDVFEASCLQTKIITFSRQCCRALMGVFCSLWVLLPLLDVVFVLRSASGPAASGGDIAARILWVLAGVPRACFMTGVMGPLLVVLKLHSFDLKAVRAAARLAPKSQDLNETICYFSSLLNVYLHNNALLNASSVKLQRLVCLLRQASGPTWLPDSSVLTSRRRCAFCC